MCLWQCMNVYDYVWPSVEDDLWWKMTLGGRRPLVEDNLQWKTNFDGRQYLVEEGLRWKTTFGGRWPLVENNLQWKMHFGGRLPSMEDNLWWKTTFSGRRPLLDPCMLPTLLCGIFSILETFRIHSGHIQKTSKLHSEINETFIFHHEIKNSCHMHGLCKPNACPVHALCTPVHTFCMAHAHPLSRAVQTPCMPHPMHATCMPLALPVHALWTPCARPMHAPCTTRS